MRYKNVYSRDPGRISIGELRQLSKVLPVRRAISKITNDVLAMPWAVLPPEEDLKQESAWQEARRIKQAIVHPQDDPNNGYLHFASTLIADILMLGCAAMERQVGDSQSQPFRLWPIDVASVGYDEAWSPQIEGIYPRYYVGDISHPDLLVPLYNHEAFLILGEPRTYRLCGPGTVEIAAPDIIDWLYLKAVQEAKTTQVVTRDILQVVGASDDELSALRRDGSSLRQGPGEILVVNKEMRQTSLRAKTDQGLYLGYERTLLRNIAMAFSLTVQDLGFANDTSEDRADITENHSYPPGSHQMALLLHEALQLEVVDFYRPGFRCELLKAPRNQDEAREIATRLYERGIITQNEARLYTGQKPIGPAGDRFADGMPSGIHSKWSGA